MPARWTSAPTWCSPSSRRCTPPDATLRIRRVAGGSVARAIALADTRQVTLSGNRLTINPASDLEYGTAYAVELAPGALDDDAGNPFAGLGDGTAYRFATALEPLPPARSPALGSSPSRHPMHNP